VSDFPTVTFEPGQRIFNAGDAADHLYFIQQGIVQLLDAQGNVFAQISNGESFGEQAFLKGGIRGAAAQALDEVSCVQISSADANLLLAEASPLLVPVFEALLLQQNMHNSLRSTKV
jgi:CRP-like cAMP-binding protein